MKFKEIKPGMVIHCQTEEDARALLEYLKSLSYGCHFNLIDWIDENTCYVINTINKWVTRSDKKLYAENHITEFSDLVEPDDHPATTEDINWSYDPTKGYFDGKQVTDSPINTDADSPMTAVEVLEWLEKNGDDIDLLQAVFGEGCEDYDDIFGLYPAKTVYQKITAYEAEKKKPKHVELEWEDYVEIIDGYNAKTTYTRPEQTGYMTWAEEKYREWLTEHSEDDDKGTVYCGHRPRVKEGKA